MVEQRLDEHRDRAPCELGLEPVDVGRRMRIVVRMVRHGCPRSRRLVRRHTSGRTYSQTTVMRPSTLASTPKRRMSLRRWSGPMPRLPWRVSKWGATERGIIDFGESDDAAGRSPPLEGAGVPSADLRGVLGRRHQNTGLRPAPRRWLDARGFRDGPARTRFLSGCCQCNGLRTSGHCADRRTSRPGHGRSWGN